MPYPIQILNEMSEAEFVRIVGPVFEHSPWIARATYPHRPFASFEDLKIKLCRVVETSGESAKLELIQAHPDLVGRAAKAGILTEASTKEQTIAGLGTLSPGEIAKFEQYNAAYRKKFGFPFVICARLNKKDAILNAFPVRLENSREAEMKTALTEIFKIAELRLRDIAR